MIDFKEFEEIAVSDIDDINHYIDKMSGFIPLVDEGDYLAIKKYVRKILEVIEKGEKDE